MSDIEMQQRPTASRKNILIVDSSELMQLGRVCKRISVGRWPLCRHLDSAVCQVLRLPAIPPACPGWRLRRLCTHALVVSSELQMRGTYNLTEVHTGREALEQVAASRYDVVIMSNQLPDMLGVDLCVLMTRNISTQHVKIMILSSDSDNQLDIIASSSGADMVIQKPFSLHFVSRAVDLLIARDSTSA